MVLRLLHGPSPSLLHDHLQDIGVINFLNELLVVCPSQLLLDLKLLPIVNDLLRLVDRHRLDLSFLQKVVLDLSGL